MNKNFINSTSKNLFGYFKTFEHWKFQIWNTETEKTNDNLINFKRTLNKT